jgi:hypothetical protein
MDTQAFAQTELLGTHKRMGNTKARTTNRLMLCINKSSLLAGERYQITAETVIKASSHSLSSELALKWPVLLASLYLLQR